MLERRSGYLSATFGIRSAIAFRFLEEIGAESGKTWDRAIGYFVLSSN
jgi:hypothetical protein